MFVKRHQLFCLFRMKASYKLVELEQPTWAFLARLSWTKSLEGLCQLQAGRAGATHLGVFGQA